MRRLDFLSWLLLCATLLTAVPAHAIEYGGFGIRPANPRPDNPRTESIFVHTINPGTSVEEAVTVLNNTQSTKTFLLYSADSTPSTDGAFACEQMSDEKDGPGSWITLEKTELTLPPSSNETVKFTIAVPPDPPVGENDGCILIQEKKEVPEGDDPTKSGVQLSIRSGIRVALTVPGDIKRGLEFVKFDIFKNDKGVTVLHPGVKNTGNVSVDANVSVVTRYWTGWTFMRHGGQYPILARRTSEWNFELPKSFWGGVMFARASATYDPDVDAEVGKNTGGKTVRVSGPTRFMFFVPTLWGAVIELVILALLVLGSLWLVAAIKRRKWMQQEWVEYKVKAGDDLVSLGQKFNVDWKWIAVRNRIRAPYLLRVGEIILVPNGTSASDRPKGGSGTKFNLEAWFKKLTKKNPTEPPMMTLVADRGDKLKDIADYAGVTVAQLVKLNGITNSRAYKVKAGQEFLVPDFNKISEANWNKWWATKETAVSPAPPKPTKIKVEPKAHRVAVRNLISVIAEKGDKLKDIADYAGITVAELAKLNRIKNPKAFKVKVGEQFIIPDPESD